MTLHAVRGADEQLQADDLVVAEKLFLAHRIAREQRGNVGIEARGCRQQQPLVGGDRLAQVGERLVYGRVVRRVRQRAEQLEVARAIRRISGHQRHHVTPLAAVFVGILQR